jgi:hypothetical protein
MLRSTELLPTKTSSFAPLLPALTVGGGMDLLWRCKASKWDRTNIVRVQRVGGGSFFFRGSLLEQWRFQENGVVRRMLVEPGPPNFSSGPAPMEVGMLACIENYVLLILARTREPPILNRSDETLQNSRMADVAVGSVRRGLLWRRGQDLTGEEKAAGEFVALIARGYRAEG